MNPRDKPPSRGELLREAVRVDGLLCLLTDRIDARVMEQAKRLRVIGNMVVGYDNVDIVEATNRGIMVTNTPGILTETVADLTVGLMIAIARRIASGPTTFDTTTFMDAKAVFEQRGMWQKVPASVRNLINDGVAGLLKETPKRGSPVFAKTALETVATNRVSWRAAADELRARGYQTKIVSTSLEGEAKQVGTKFVQRLGRDSRSFHRRYSLVGGGETTVSVT